ncbi:ribosomal RNA processing protein 1 homolog A isoform X2 [Vulpes lagopus]|uniref:ribosomal RNA processing protein 1 homolog A isoform X2 n=1 Tax=Vulpes lagopus TaxID=494514 RepID=UPI001BC90B52|nr:ribosomal RNA processing protein 1 homolog A isoform X2 [Vulpes lagopus]
MERAVLLHVDAGQAAPPGRTREDHFPAHPCFSDHRGTAASVFPCDSLLVCSPPSEHLFLQTFWQTMNREWTGIDRLRLDKFYMLMRMVLNESLKALKTQGWEERQIEQLLELLTTEILHPDSQAPSGVKSHFLEIFLEELSKVGAAELTADQNLRFIDPFCTIAARTKDSLVLHNITRGIFEAIVEQAPFAIEDLLNEVDSQEEDDDDDDEDNEDGMSEDDECKQDVPSGKPGSLRGAACDPSDEPVGDGEDSVGPVLQFDYEAVASRLFAVASQQSTPSQNRKRLYKVIRKLQDLAEGEHLMLGPWLATPPSSPPWDAHWLHWLLWRQGFLSGRGGLMASAAPPRQPPLCAGSQGRAAREPAFPASSQRMMCQKKPTGTCRKRGGSGGQRSVCPHPRLTSQVGLAVSAGGGAIVPAVCVPPIASSPACPRDCGLAQWTHWGGGGGLPRASAPCT